MSNNNNYCFIKPTNSFTTPDPNGITDNSTNSGMINDGTSTSNPNQGDPNHPNINTEISIINTIFTLSQSNINLNTITISNSSTGGALTKVADINSDYGNFLVNGSFRIDAVKINPVNEGFFYIDIKFYNAGSLIFQDDKLYRINTDLTKYYGFNYLLKNHDTFILTISDRDNIDTTTNIINGYIKWVGLLK